MMRQADRQPGETLRWCLAATLITLLHQALPDRAVAQQAFQPPDRSESAAPPKTADAAAEVPPPPPRAEPAASTVPEVPRDPDVPRDPTVPSPEILQRMQPRQPEAPGAAPTRPASTPLPELPNLQLKAIVLSSASSGTALLVAGEQSISVRLGRSADQAAIRFPPRQFSQYRETLDRMDAMLSQAEPSSEELPAPAPEQLLRLDGFAIDGIFFSVEDFSDRAVLLRAYPHDQFVLVQ